MQSNQFSGRSDESSLIRGSREKKRPQKKTDWGRTLYLTFLALMALLLIYYAISSFVTLEGNGRVLTNKMTIRSPTDIQIHQLINREGMEVERGDTLFAYQLTKWNPNMDSLKSVEQERRDLELQIRDISQQIKRKKQEIVGVSEQLESLRERRDLIVKEIKLNVQSPARIHSVEQQIVELQTRVELLKRELQNLEEQRNQLQSDKRNIPSLTAYGRGNIENLRIFESPIDGTISSIYTDSQNILMGAERILTIERDRNEIRIRASFSESTIQYMEQGKLLEVEFANGVQTSGIINDYYMTFTDYLRDKHWTEGIQPSSDVFTTTDQFFTNPRVIVDLRPTNQQVEDIWRANNHVSVDVFVKKVAAWPTTL